MDLDPTDPNPILRQKLIDELTSPDDTLQVGLPGDRRLTVMPQIAPLDSPNHPPDPARVGLPGHRRRARRNR